jgi:mannose-1-phosphate guanylyltransferase
MTQAILLVGGLGTRLMPLTRNSPKPMLPIAGLPITEHQLVKAKKAGITSLVLATSYLSDVFIPYFGDGSRWGMRVQYAVEEEPLGTGGGIRNASQFLNDEELIVILNGDVLSSHDLAGQIRYHKEHEADVTLHLTHVDDARPFGCVPLDEEGRVIAFLEKMDNPVVNTINAGCYVFSPRVIEEIPAGRSVSIEREIFPSLIAREKPIFGVVDDSYWIDLGTPRALLQGSADVVSGLANGDALDRLGITNRSKEFVVLEGATIHPTAFVGGGSSLGFNSKLMEGSEVIGSIVCANATIMQNARVVNSFVAEGAIVKAGVDISNAYVSLDGIENLD